MHIFFLFNVSSNFLRAVSEAEKLQDSTPWGQG